MSVVRQLRMSFSAVIGCNNSSFRKGLIIFTRVACSLAVARQPSKHAGSDSHPVRIGSEALTRSVPDDSCILGFFRTGSVRPKSDTVSLN